MARKNLEQRLELVRTVSGNTYVGVVKETDTYVHLERAALIDEDAKSAEDIAFCYFSEKARRQLKPVDLPRSAVEMKTYDPTIMRLFHTYEELSKTAGRKQYGKRKITRLKKLLGR